MAYDNNLFTRRDGLQYTQIFYNSFPIDAIEDSIKETDDLVHSTNTHVGVKASDTTFIGEYGRKLTFKTIVPANDASLTGKEHKIQDYIELKEYAKQNPCFLTSNSYAQYNGKYILTKFDKEEDSGGNFEIDWELQEIITAPVISKTFRVWGKAPTTKASSTAKKVTVSSNTQYLLKKCPTLSRKQYETKHNVPCVLRLQDFLRAGGFYLKYKRDGWFSKYTEQELKKAQKKRKLPQSGIWDAKTIAFYKKLYKIK